MICQAFGIPGIGVGQPSHACVAYKTAYPMTQPQPGSAWKVGYGRGWQFSKLEGMSGLDFMAAVEQRSHAAEFSQVEHLRWLASSLASKDQAAEVMAVAHKIQESTVALKTDVTASAHPEEAEKNPQLAANAANAMATAPKGPVKPLPAGTCEAASCSAMSGAKVLDSYTGGKQVNFQQSADGWVEYALNAPAAGTYTLTIKLATPNLDQVLDISASGNKLATINVPNTTGLWATTPATEIKLEKGRQTLRISAPAQRGLAMKSFELKPGSVKG
jgi:hypothetical protein